MVNFSVKSNYQKYPQAKNIHKSLMYRFFHDKLSLDELDCLKYGFSWLDNKKFDRLSELEKKRLFICLLLSERKEQMKPEHFIQCGITQFYLSDVHIFRYAALAGHFAILEQLKSRLQTIQIFSVFEDIDMYEMYVKQGDVSGLKTILNFEVTSGVRAQDLLIYEDLARLLSTASTYGHLEIVQYIERLLGNDFLRALQSYCKRERKNTFEPFANACYSGNINLVQYLAKSFPDNGRAAINALKPYQMAGSLEFIQMRESYLDENQGDREVNDRKFYFALSSAIDKDNDIAVNTIKEKIEAFSQEKIMDFLNYTHAFLFFYNEGNQTKIENYEKYLGIDNILLLGLMEKEFSLAFIRESWTLDFLKYFHTRVGEENFKTFLESKLFLNYYWAACTKNINFILYMDNIIDRDFSDDELITLYEEFCRSGHLAAVKHIEPRLEAKGLLQQVMYENKKIYQNVCSSGNLELIHYIEEKLQDNKLTAIEKDNFYIYRCACEYGRLQVVKHLEQILGPRTIEAIRASSHYAKEETPYYAYQAACEHGHLDVVLHLEKHLKDESLDAIRAGNYRAYEKTCTSLHDKDLELVRHLENKLGSELNNALKSGDFYALRCSMSPYRRSLNRHLLNHPSCFAYAESHEREYKDYVYPLVKLKLNLLSKQKQEFETKHPNERFDIHETQMVIYYYYILRHLIRLNDESLNESIDLLLSISNLVYIVHAAVDHDEENELLKLALRQNNQYAVEKLLAFPHVRELAERNNFYRQETTVFGGDLRDVAENRESSMRGLNPEELKIMADIEVAYGTEMQNLGGISGTLTCFKNELKENYLKNPARIIFNSGQETTLPFEWTDLERLGKHYNGNFLNRALKAYFLHPDHTAYRYLSIPNYWIDPNAAFIAHGPNHTHWANFKDFEKYIAYFYLAAKDKKIGTIQDITPDARFRLFIKEISLIARAHNWDRPILKKDAQGKEEYVYQDDLERDKPSCESGIMRRLFQSVLKHPLFGFGVNLDVIEQMLHELIRESMQKILLRKSREELQAIEISLTAHFISLERVDAQLISCNLSEIEIQKIMKGLTDRLGSMNLNHLEWLNFAKLKLELKDGETHLTKFYTSCYLEKEIKKLLNEQPLFPANEIPSVNDELIANRNTFFSEEKICVRLTDDIFDVERTGCPCTIQ